MRRQLVKPVLIRRPIKQSVRIIISPRIQKTAATIEAAKPTPKPAAKAAAVPGAVKQPLLKRPPQRRNGPVYISKDITPASIARINALRDNGAGRNLIIVGNGPSLNEVPIQQLTHQPSIDILSINTPDLRVWPTSYWGFCDPTQYKRHEALWREYEGVIINSTAVKQQKSKSMQIKNLGPKGFSRDLVKGFYIGHSTVYAMMQVAYWMNYKKVYILGVDMDPGGLNGNLHFYGTNPDVAPDRRRERFTNEAKCYDYAAELLTYEERQRFVFCSTYLRWPFADRFGRLDHLTAVDTILASCI